MKIPDDILSRTHSPSAAYQMGQMDLKREILERVYLIPQRMAAERARIEDEKKKIERCKAVIEEISALGRAAQTA